MVGLLCSVLNQSQTKTDAMIYVIKAHRGSGSAQALVYQDSKLDIQSSGLTFKLPKGVESARLNPDRKVAAFLCSGNKLFVADASGGKEPRMLPLAKLDKLGSRVAEAMAWANSRRLLVYMHDPKSQAEDLIVCYDFDGESFTSSVHKPDSALATPFTQYRDRADRAYAMLEAKDVVLLGHHRAKPYTAQELFGYFDGTGLGAISEHGDLVVVRDLLGADILVFKQGGNVVRLERKSNSGVVQMRAAGNLLLIRTQDGKCELWDMAMVRFVDSVDCDMILDVFDRK